MTLEQLSAAATEAIKTTGYKYFGDYELSKDQWEAVDALVEFARVVTYQLRTGQLVEVQPDDATVERLDTALYNIVLLDPNSPAADIARQARAGVAAMPSQAALQGEMETPSPYRCKHGCERDALKDLNHAQTAEIERLKSRLAHVEKMYVQEALSKGPKP